MALDHSGLTQANGQLVERDVVLTGFSGDAGALQYSTDGGTTWLDLRPELLTANYGAPDNVGARPVFAGGLALLATDRLRLVPFAHLGSADTGSTLTYFERSHTEVPDWRYVSITPIGNPVTIGLQGAGDNIAPAFAAPIGGGAVRIDFHAPPLVAPDTLQRIQRPEGAVMLPDGSLVLAGYAYLPSGLADPYDTFDTAVARLTADGRLDAGFDGDGLVTPRIIIRHDEAFDITAQPDGKLVLVGHVAAHDVQNGTTEDFRVIRLNRDGSYDSSFASGGFTTQPVGSSDDYAQRVTVEANRTILVLGDVWNGSNWDIGLLRLMPDGSLGVDGGNDPLASGRMTLNFGDGDDLGRVLLSDVRGRILVGGWSSNGNDADFVLRRLGYTGVTDTSFGSGGTFRLSFGSGADQALDAIVQPDGAILLTGLASVGGRTVMAVTRITEWGTLDTGFGTGGTATVAVGSGHGDAQGVALQPDGKILLAGSAINGGVTEMTVVRLLANGQLDTSFDGDGIASLPLGAGPSRAFHVFVQPGGQILHSGMTTTNTQEQFVALRLNPDGSLDSSYGATTGSSTLGGMLSYTEGSPAVALDTNVVLYDAEHARAGHYGDSRLVIDGPAIGSFAATGTLAPLRDGGRLVVNGVDIGTVRLYPAQGDLVLVFDEDATQALVNAAARQIGFFSPNIHEPVDLALNWRFHDSAQAGAGDFVEGVVTVRASGGNDPPLAAPVSLGRMAENGSKFISKDQLLKGVTDSDSPANHLSFTLSVDPALGQLSGNAAQGWTFAPEDNFSGVVPFTYTVHDGTSTRSSTASLVVDQRLVYTPSTLTFAAKNLSLWGGQASASSFSTGNDFVYDPARVTKNLGGTFLGVGFEGKAYVDFAIGLRAWAQLPTAGTFDPTFTLNVNVGRPAGLDVSLTRSMLFDFSSWSYGSSSVRSIGFRAEASAGLNLVVELKAGLTDMKVVNWFDDIELPDFTLANVARQEIALITVGGSDPLVEFDEFGLSFEARMPQGADTSATAAGSSVSAFGVAKQPFMSLSADIGELLAGLLDLIPNPVAKAASKVVEVLLTSHEFDLHDKIKAIPRDAVTIKATVLSAVATLGANLTETVGVNITGRSIGVALRSDNGTPGNTLDDRTVSGLLGDKLKLDAPATGTGVATVTATYTLPGFTLSHRIGVALTYKLTLSALQATLDGDWVPKVDFGPLATKSFPGNASINLPVGLTRTLGFGEMTTRQTYEVFYTDNPPPDWDPLAANARKLAIDYQLSSNPDRTPAASTPPDLWGGNQQQDLTIAGGSSTVPAGTQDTTWTWAGGGNYSLTFANPAQAPGTFVIVNGSTLGPLRANLTLAAGTVPAAPIGFDAGAADKLALLHGLAAALSLRVQAGSGAQARTLLTNHAVDIVGSAYGDVLVLLPDGARGARLFDGGAQGLGEHDVFFANLLASDPDTAVVWNLNQAALAGSGSNLLAADAAHPTRTLTVKNVEAMWLITGNQADQIVTHVFADRVETSAGNDLVVVVADQAADAVATGAGDDDIVVTAASVVGDDGPAFTDTLSGGTGTDEARFVTATAQGLRIDLVANGASTFGSQGLGAGASLVDLLRLKIVAAEYFLAPGNATLPANRVAGDDALLFINGSQSQGTTRFEADIEAIAVEASDLANDLVLFTGAAAYDGGNGPASAADTFVADFHAYAARLNPSSGVRLAAHGGVNTFAGITASGFERLVVAGAGLADVLQGGSLGDLLSGEAGNDELDGGYDSVRDVLLGGAGSDSFYWFDFGPDVMDGDEGRTAASVDDADHLIIGATGQEAGGLVWDVQQRLGVEAALAGTVAADAASGLAAGFVGAHSSATDLLAFMSLAAAAESAGNVLAVSFGGGAANAAYMNYAGIESVNIAGSVVHDDLLYYQGGASYDGGETNGDADTLLADFRGQTAGIELVVNDSAQAGSTTQELLNGVVVSGIDRAVVLAGGGDDQFRGGSLGDYVDGGAGDDQLWGRSGDDTMLGGPGSDLLYWYGDGNDSVGGGDGFDTLIVAAQGLGVQVLFDGMYASKSTGMLTAASPPSAIVSMLRDMADAPIKELRLGSESGQLSLSGVESINVFGQGGANHLVVFRNGTSYSGSSGDADVFAADFRGSAAALALQTGAAIEDIGIGTRIEAFERLLLLLGEGHDSVAGGDLADYLDGGGGNDTLAGGAGDSLFGGPGDDALAASDGGSLLHGGDGTDSADVQGLGGDVSVALYSSKGGVLQQGGVVPLASREGLTNLFTKLPQTVRVVFGTSSGPLELRDVERLDLSSGDGDDVLLSGSAGGTLRSGAGSDLLISRGGNDALVGGAGADTYAFDRNMGHDLVLGETEAGATLIFIGHTLAELGFARAGSDLKINAVGGSVTVPAYFAGGGNGLNFSFSTSDFSGTRDLTGLAGGSGAAAHTVFGTAGDDEIASPGAGADSLFGAGGNDFFSGGPGADFIDGGSGIDAVSYAASSSAVTVNLLAGNGSGGDAEGDLLRGIEAVVGAPVGSVLSGDANANTLVAGDGDDTLAGDDGGDVLIGGGGNDGLAGDAGSDSLSGGDGDDTLAGHAGGDILKGGGGNDSLSGGDDGDVLDGGGGDDAMQGGAGDDSFIYGLLAAASEDSAAAADGRDSVHGGDGIDTLDLSVYPYAVAIDLNSSGAAVITRGGPDLLPATGALLTLLPLAEVERVAATLWSDDLLGDAAANLLQGGSGDDTLAGSAGADTLRGDGGSDSADYARGSGAGGIVLDFRGASRTVTDSWGHVDLLDSIENIVGSAQADTIRMDAADNRIVGAGGDDLLEGGGGDDTLDGGDGDDTATFSGARAAYTIVLLADGLHVSSGSEGSDLLLRIEQLQFSDQTVAATSFNLAPESANTSGNLAEDSVLDAQLPAAIDANGDAIAYSKASDPAHGTLTVNANGSYSYAPAANYNGSDSFGFRVADPAGAGNSYTVSLTVTPVNDAPSGAVAISGTARVGETLTATQTIADIDGLGTLAYQWQRGDAAIVGATGSSHTLVSADAGHAISVRVSWTDGGGTAESLASVATAPVQAAVSVITGTTGDDTLLGGSGADRIVALAGNDLLNGDGGSDTLDGGEGFDVASWGPTTGSAAINASLLTGLVTQGADIDALIGIEAIFGTAAADTLRGADGPANQRGETFRGGTGSDAIDGGSGVDRVEFVGARAGYTVTRNGNQITVIDNNGADGSDGTDELHDVERLLFSDTMLAFGTRAEEIARVAFVLWSPAIVGSASLFARGYSYYDGGGYDFAEMCGAALQFHTEQGLEYALKLKANMPGTTKTVDQIVAVMNAAGGGQAGRIAALIEMANDAATEAAIAASGIRTAGVVADLVVPGFGALFGLLPGG